LIKLSQPKHCHQRYFHIELWTMSQIVPLDPDQCLLYFSALSCSLAHRDSM
jgi:hypothetical protein